MVEKLTSVPPKTFVTFVSSALFVFVLFCCYFPMHLSLRCPDRMLSPFPRTVLLMLLLSLLSPLLILAIARCDTIICATMFRYCL